MPQPERRVRNRRRSAMAEGGLPPDAEFVAVPRALFAVTAAAGLDPTGLAALVVLLDRQPARDVQTFSCSRRVVATALGVTGQGADRVLARLARAGLIRQRTVRGAARLVDLRALWRLMGVAEVTPTRLRAAVAAARPVLDVQPRLPEDATRVAGSGNRVATGVAASGNSPASQVGPEQRNQSKSAAAPPSAPRARGAAAELQHGSDVGLAPDPAAWAARQRREAARMAEEESHDRSGDREGRLGRTDAPDDERLQEGARAATA